MEYHYWLISKMLLKSFKIYCMFLRHRWYQKLWGVVILPKKNSLATTCCEFCFPKYCDIDPMSCNIDQCPLPKQKKRKKKTNKDKSTSPSVLHPLNTHQWFCEKCSICIHMLRGAQAPRYQEREREREREGGLDESKDGGEYLTRINPLLHFNQTLGF